MLTCVVPAVLVAGCCARGTTGPEERQREAPAVRVPSESMNGGVPSLTPASLTRASLTPASLTPASLTPASLTPASLTPASLTPASLTPAGGAPGHIAATDDGACQSDAIRLTLKGVGLPLDEVMAVLAEVSGTAIGCDCDFTAVTADVQFDGVPWDCVLVVIARRLGREVELSTAGIRLVAPNQAGTTVSGPASDD
jgi:hypothetical protein